MIAKTEDLFGRTALILIYSFFALRGLHHIQVLLSHPWTHETWLLDVVARIAGFLFLILVVATTLTRLPPKNTAAGWEPRVSAIIGTFAMLTLIVLPRADVGVELKFVGALLIIVGTTLSVYCPYWLGRSFSVMAHARELVRVGPYSVIRHPLYASEMVALLGVILANLSLPTVLAAAVTIVFQFRRMRNEEGVLRATFPEYEKYGQEVPMFIPVPVSRR